MGFKDVHFLEIDQQCVERHARPSTKNKAVRWRNGRQVVGSYKYSIGIWPHSESNFVINATQMRNTFINIHVGNQAHPYVLELLKERTIWSRGRKSDSLSGLFPGPGNIAGFELIIDDGGHHNEEILPTFHSLWPEIEPGGMYIVEDAAGAAYCSYDGQGTLPHDGGEQPGSFQWALKHMVDRMLSISHSPAKRNSDSDYSLIECQFNVCGIRKAVQNERY